MKTSLTQGLAASILAAAVLAGASVRADDFSFVGESRPAIFAGVMTTPTIKNWMNSDVQGAWNAGFTGTGTRITVVDDFTSNSLLTGNMGLGSQRQRHGDWTFEQSGLIASGATMAKQDFNSGGTVALATTGLNVLNLSYGMFASSTISASRLGWAAEEASIISYARDGKAVISKAAGNDAVVVGGTTSAGTKDFLDLALIGTKSAIFVGALNTNGSTSAKASLASYSNRAGSDVNVQSHFIVVGVDSNKIGLAGTSFAAPIVSGYAAILGSKFKTATATQITNQLLNTARTDTIANYSAAVYGKGEASLSRALAPIKIN